MVPDLINEQIDVAGTLQALNRWGRVQIRDFLQPEAASSIHECLARQVPWTLAICDEEGMRTIPNDEISALSAEERRQFYERIARSGSGGEYRFAYDSYMMPRAYLEGRDRHLILHSVLEFLNSARFISFMRDLGGDARLQRIDAQATRYQPGHFLRTHNDEHSGEQRLFAYVLNLTRRWVPDWGGLLHFLDEDGQVVDVFMPHWNSLTLFRVPQRHHVSVVAPWAEEDRFAITGWGLATSTAHAAKERMDRLKSSTP